MAAQNPPRPDSRCNSGISAAVALTEFAAVGTSRLGPRAVALRRHARASAGPAAETHDVSVSDAARLRWPER